MLTKERIAEALSKVLSDQYGADIRITFKSPQKEQEENVPNMSTDTMSDTMSQRCAEDCA